MLLGIYGDKRNIITDEINRGLTEILLKITLPLMIVSSFVFTFDESMKKNITKTFIYAFLTFVIVAIISYVFLIPIKSKKREILQFANVFSNCGFIGFPIMESIYGFEGVLYTSIFNMYFAIFTWTYGIMIFTGKVTFKEIKKVLLNPCVIAVYIGIFIMKFNIQIPIVIYSTIKIVGAMTSPLSMIIVGVILSKANIKDNLKDWTIYYGSVIKLLVIPVLLYLITLIINDNSKVANTMLILSAMPAAAMTSILAENFNKEKEYAAVIVFFTTLISLITFPIILKLIS
jgi:predicted permease